LTINGRAASATQLIWAGDLLQALPDTSVPLLLDSMGMVILGRGAIATLATKYTTVEGDDKRGTLILSLVKGELSVKLQNEAVAFLCAAGSAFASSEGAVFSASVREGRALIAVKSGAVQERQSSQYTIRPVGHGSNISVETGGMRQLQVEVREDDIPVPGVGVVFVLDTGGALPGKLGLGTLSNTTLNVITNANGIAAVHFVAGPTSGTIPISATIEGTRTSWTGTITVKSRGVSRRTGWAIAAMIGAGAAAGIAYALTREKDDLRAQPPTVGRP
jgi:hypothetical protein